MRVLVYPHDLNMGGSQLNAIEIAAQLRELGVESIVFGVSGVLRKRITELGLEFIESPDPGRRPSIRIASLLRGIAQHRGVDILHGYEWPPSLECYAATWGMDSTRSVSTVMSMAVPPFIPTAMPLVVGTAQIAAAESERGRKLVSVIEPPVDLRHNVPPPAVEVEEFRRAWSIRPDSTLIVCVTRLATELKLEGLLSAVSSLETRLGDLPVQLMIVGDGPAHAFVRDRAAVVNERCGSQRVVLTGEMPDPRVAYAAADIVLGMGGSALRALAFSKPLIVQGERGFFQLLTPETMPTFAWQGWYGVGSDSSVGPEQFAGEVRDVWPESRRLDLGLYGRRALEEGFSLETAARRQFEIYQSALSSGPHYLHSAVAGAQAGARFTSYYLNRKWIKLRGHGSVADDFNATPVAASASSSLRREVDSARTAAVLLYLSGTPWHAVAGTDAQLAAAMGKNHPVVWVDPPISIFSRIRRRIKIPPVSEVAPGVIRLHTTTLPGVTRIGIRWVSRMAVKARVKRYLNHSRNPIGAVLSSSPEPVLADWTEPGIPCIYFATDDFAVGATLLGMSRRHSERSQARSVRAADAVLAVSPVLVNRLRKGGGSVHLFPNGCDVHRYRDIDLLNQAPEICLPHPIAGLVGQINERLNLELIEEIARRGVSILMVGPRYERDQGFRQRLSAVVDLPNVQWIDRQPPDRLPSFMAAIKVGLTPYSRSSFNDASFPLKTLEYLAAGRPVAATPLPAHELLDSLVVRVADTSEHYANLVEEMLKEVQTHDLGCRCRAEAQKFSWEARAAELESIVVQLRRAERADR